MSDRQRDHDMHPAARDEAGDTSAPQTWRAHLAAASAPAAAPLTPTDVQVAALVRTLARIIRRQCTVPARTEEGPRP
jgi:hypothetical protein